MKRVRFRSFMPVPAADLYSWHAQEGAFERLVPSWQNVEILSRDGSIRDGDVLTMKLRLGPLGKTWVASHDCHIEGKQFRDTQVSGPFAVWHHTHRMHEKSSQSSILDDDISYEVPLERILDPIAARLVHKEIRRMFRFRHLRTRLDLQQHNKFRQRERIGFATVGSHSFARQLGAFLTGGGHQEVCASIASVLIDLRPLSETDASMLKLQGGQRLISLQPDQSQHAASAGKPGHSAITVPKVVIGPSFKMPGLPGLLRAVPGESSNAAQNWIAEDDLIWMVYSVALNPEQSSEGFTKTFTSQDAAKRFLAGRL